MLVGYFESIPIELEESAMRDGCNRFGALCRVAVLPLAAPGVAATAIFAFVASWSELLFAITFTPLSENAIATVTSAGWPVSAPRRAVRFESRPAATGRPAAPEPG